MTIAEDMKYEEEKEDPLHEDVLAYPIRILTEEGSSTVYFKTTIHKNVQKKFFFKI